jgi:hypothetical protein
MYTSGNIIYFTPFYFSDGTSPKPKYFIVLKENRNENSILASLTTKLDCVPGDTPKNQGSIDVPEINFNCYYIQKDRIITDSGWAFPKDTYVYGYRLIQLDISDLNAKYKIENVDYQIKGKILP